MLELLVAQSAIIHTCEDTKLASQCTTTQIGEAVITAFHCVRRCTPEDLRYSVDLDIIILKEGPVTDADCLDAAVGDKVTASGWPNTGYEQMSGEIKKVINTHRIVDGENVGYKLIYDVDFSILGGYSGGPLTLDSTGRTVGMNYAGGLFGTSSLTVSTACAFIRGEYDELNKKLQSDSKKVIQPTE